jgi:hypothetical protein
VKKNSCFSHGTRHSTPSLASPTPTLTFDATAFGYLLTRQLPHVPPARLPGSEARASLYLQKYHIEQGVHRPRPGR